MVASLVDEKLEARLEELRAQAVNYSEAEAQRTYLNHFRKSKLAILMQEAEGRGVKAISAQERDARAHPDYIQLLEALRTATEVAEKNSWLLRIAMRGSSLYQTQQATLRAEIAAYNTKTA